MLLAAGSGASIRIESCSGTKPRGHRRRELHFCLPERSSRSRNVDVRLEVGMMCDQRGCPKRTGRVGERDLLPSGGARYGVNVVALGDCCSWLDDGGL